MAEGKAWVLFCYDPPDIDRWCIYPQSTRFPNGRGWLSYLQSCEGSPMEPRPKQLLDHVRDAIRLKHSSIRTEES